ncbi:helicase-related protein [Clostridioides sp. ZZV14-6104]|uniref:helicase-related protein n=1 Tax=Clostridioides sp. ZZV14-6104 TaxID=2811491 RepID=UPI001D111B7E|nr:DEAD/DEAH box helicase [Clostridioides sp. ZZV14-6104]
MELKEIRNIIYKSVKEELLGPGSEETGLDKKEEIITDRPSQRYSTGILFTKENISEKFEDEVCEDVDIIKNESEYEIQKYKNNLSNKYKEKDKTSYIDKIDEELYEDMNNAHIIKKSSMGMTFFCDKDLCEIKISLKGARYLPTKINECMISYTGNLTSMNDESIAQYIYYDNGMLLLHKGFTYSQIKSWEKSGIFRQQEEFKNAVYKLCNQCANRMTSYKRKEIKFLNPINLYFGGKNQAAFTIEDEQLKIFAIKKEYKGKFGITVMLINEAEGFDDTKYVFQPEIIIDSCENNITFLSSHSLENSINPQLDLLYRHKKSYGIGHGTSVDFSEVNVETGIGRIRTNYMPSYEVPNTKFDVEPTNSFDILSMLNLSDLSDIKKEVLIKELEEFVQNYEKWIYNIDLKLQNELLDNQLKNIAKENIKSCRVAKERMYEGIKILLNNEEAFKAFQLANKSMLIQRIQSKYKKEVDSKHSFEAYKKYSIKEARWRGFQLGFLLMTIASIVNKKNKFRDIVDLIWIPTGGGKTEAYLGVSAFTIFYRRLNRKENGYGTAIIMRYTLRLLATQQFERACKLICACEYIRREEAINLGDLPISIGLWIGANQTPNSIYEADKIKKELLNDKNSDNKFQLLKCPWCGEPLTKLDENSSGEWGYKITRGKDKKFVFICPSSKCYFNEELPVQVVDECLYEEPPTLLFSTVDKFAMLPWKEKASSFFGHGSENDCPELIIQDELHLISGPLGTLVSLFETSIDYLCGIKGVRPKIISSTATICEANNQVKNLYNRDTSQFPPIGIEIEDSYFVKEEVNLNKAGRLYIGVCGIGQTQTTTEIRLFASILQRVSRLNIPYDIKDKYWTLVSYFNSIRELGKASTLIYDDVKDYMIRIANRNGKMSDIRKIYSASELTSRISSSQIIKTLNDLDKEYPNKDVVNVLLATNMISVGVDVARMNIMTIIGQPKLTSEYIQASSRVGRSDPGIVFTLYDGRKSRDESHYEIFQSYHQAFYKYVEPTSITPFSEPALERMLHSVFITMVRHSTDLNDERSACYFDENDLKIREIRTFILDRCYSLNKSDYIITKRILDDIIAKWKYKAEITTDALQYSKGKNPLMDKFYQKTGEIKGFNTMQSMRTVDKEVKIKILSRED